MAPLPTRAIPQAAIARLPVYLRVLERLAEAGSPTVSSDLLADLAGTSAAIVRKDLSYLGSLGTRGAGYEVTAVRDRLTVLLGADRRWPVAIMGAGNLGRALANYLGMSGPSFVLSALFDVDPHKVGTRIGGVAICHLDDLESVVSTTRISIGVITTPASSAAEVADRLVSAGVRSILNFAPVRLSGRDGVLVRDVDVGLHLLVLSFNELRRTP